jgi:hypothetical protein
MDVNNMNEGDLEKMLGDANKVLGQYGKAKRQQERAELSLGSEE